MMPIRQLYSGIHCPKKIYKIHKQRFDRQTKCICVFGHRLHCQTLSVFIHTKIRKIIRAVFFYLIPIRRKVAAQNLSLCFPEKDKSWRNNIMRESYINLGINLFEFLYFPSLKENDIRKIVTYHNHEPVDESISEGKGTFLLSGHLSNWELEAFAYPAIYKRKLNIIARIQASRLLNAKINEFRTLYGNEIIEIGPSLKSVFRKIHDNEIVCFLIDQSAHPDYSSYVDFFGISVTAFSGPAKLALKLRPGLIVAYEQRQKDFSYKIYFERILYDDITGATEENITLLTQRIQSHFENVIRKSPGEWLWFHKRFKHIK